MQEEQRWYHARLVEAVREGDGASTHHSRDEREG